MPRLAAGPGIRKVHRAPQVSSVLRRLVRCEPSWVQALFTRADIISEGAFAADRLTYYGTTSIVLSLDQPMAPDGEASGSPSLAKLLAFDPHARVLALRVARTEALVRAAVPLATMFSELTYVTPPNELRFQIEVEARRADQRALPGARRAAK